MSTPYQTEISQNSNNNNGHPINLVIPESVRDDLVNRIIRELDVRRTSPQAWVKDWVPIIVLFISLLLAFGSMRTELAGLKEQLAFIRSEIVPRNEQSARDTLVDKWQTDTGRRLDDLSRRIDRVEEHIIFTVGQSRISEEIANHDAHTEKRGK